jgi:RimJ/RimL family protein N-acetyltransferase
MQKEVNFIISSEKDCYELACFNKALIDDGGSNNTMTFEELENRMHKFLSEGYIAIIFEVDKAHIGYTLVDRSKTPIFIRQFFIAKQFRRKGYGSTAFNKLIDFLNIDKVDLSVLASNNIGYKFWTKCGFASYEIVMHYKKEELN